MSLRTVLKPFKACHLPLLETWLHRPHVARWFPNPEEHMAMAWHPPAGRFQTVIAVDNIACGYLRWHRVSRRILDELGLMDIPGNTMDADIFIGEEAYLGRGIGRAALGLLADRLRKDPDVPMLALTVSLENESARMAYERVGFCEAHIYEAPGLGLCRLMLLDLR